MATYSWTGTDPRGRSSQGRLDAASLGEAATGVRARGVSPLTLERSDVELSVRSGVTADAFTLFNQNLADMTAVGLPLPRAIREIAAGMRGGRFKRALERVDAALREGKSLGEAVAAEGSVFPPYYRWMLQAGEASGNLPAMLSAVARNTEGQRVARRAFLEATIYPTLVIFVAIVIAGLSLSVFLPFYRGVSVSQGFEVPGLPFFLSTVGTVARIGGGILGILLAVLIGGALLLRSPFGERILRNLPLIGRVRRNLILSRMLGALGVLLRAGVPLPKALPVAMGAAGSREMDRAAALLTARATEGHGLGDVLSGAPGIGPEVASFLGVAERSGDAPQSTGHVADLMMEQALADSEALFVVLMPISLLVAGIVVGGLLISLVYPYFIFIDSLHP
jgi:type IV pilus assembly protein PilC